MVRCYGHFTSSFYHQRPWLIHQNQELLNFDYKHVFMFFISVNMRVHQKNKLIQTMGAFDSALIISGYIWAQSMFCCKALWSESPTDAPAAIIRKVREVILFAKSQEERLGPAVKPTFFIPKIFTHILCRVGFCLICYNPRLASKSFGAFKHAKNCLMLILSDKWSIQMSLIVPFFGK